MATGWAKEGAVVDQINDTVEDGVSAARARLPAGESALECLVCGQDIPEPRRQATPGVKTCLACQSLRDRRIEHSLFNRRGGKDSQLR
jgi:phage/conjugal plasmid C-4 type zinc finger TraR family protein